MLVDTSDGVTRRLNAPKVFKALFSEKGIVQAGEQVKQLLMKMLSVDPTRRPSARQLLESSPLKDVTPREKFMKAWGRSWHCEPTS